MKLPQAINTFDTVAQQDIAANTTTPGELFDLKITYHPYIQKLAITASENGTLHVIDKVSGLEKDVIYGFTRLSKNTLLLEDCKRVHGERINVGDILTSSWGEYEVDKLAEYIGSYEIKNVSGSINLSFEDDKSTVFNYNTNSVSGTLTLPEITEDNDGFVTIIKRNGSNGLTLTPNAADTVNSSASFSQFDSQSLTLIANYANNDWVFIADLSKNPIRQQEYFVGKHGSDSNDGLTPSTAFITFTKAIDTINALSTPPSIANKFAINCGDAGVYTESLIIPSFTFVFAPSASIDGNHELEDFTIFKAERSVISTGIVAWKNTGTDNALVDINRIICTNTASGLICSSGGMQQKFELLEIENGFGIGDNTSNGVCHCIGISVDVSGTGTGVTSYAANESSIKISDIHVTGAGRGVWVTNGGTFKGEITHIDAPSGTAWQVDAGSNLNLINAGYEGATINNGNLRIISGTEIDLNGSPITGTFYCPQKTFAVDDTTPSIEGGNTFITSANTGATAITSLDDAFAGQVITLIGGSNTNASTITPSATFLIQDNITLNLNDSITFYAKTSSTFVELCRSKSNLTTQIIDKSSTGSLTEQEVENNLIVVDTSGGGITLTLPTTPTDAVKTIFKCKGGGLCTLTAGGGDTVESGASIILASGQSTTLIYDATNTNWLEIG